MANIKINELRPAEFAELSDLQLEAIVGGKRITKPFPLPKPKPFPFPKPRFPFPIRF